ncbi:MAG: sulfatase-like hydrolase/transferase [Myxococcota bacterium]|nr:sulfatase-like hydrolase/transferase [Myxococcota bacterium]
MEVTETKRRRTGLLARHFIWLSAISALVLPALEWIRLILSDLGAVTGFGEWTLLLLNLTGILGLPAFLVAFAVLVCTHILTHGWMQNDGPNDPSRLLLTAIYGSFGVVATGLVSYRVVTIAASQFKTTTYVGLAAALASALVALLVLLFSAPVIGWSTTLLQRFLGMRKRSLNEFLKARGTLLLALIFIVLVFSIPVVIRPLRSVELRGVQWGALWLLFSVLVSFKVVPRRSLTRMRILIVSLVICLTSFVYTAQHLRDDPNQVLSVQRDTLISGQLAKGLSKFGDSDGDGSARLFFGGDCDDANAGVRPGLYDIADDGIDQNCVGGDLKLAQPLTTKPIRRKPLPLDKKHVILLTVDALRNDTMRQHMPRLMELAKESVDFTNAYAHGAATYWSLASLVTSKLPSRLKLGRDQTPIPSEKLMTEVFRDAGWHTALFANVTVFFVRGLRQGTHVANYDTSHFTVHGAKPGSSHLTDALLKHIDRWRDGKLKPKTDAFYVWGHYYDPHDPYFEVPGFDAASSSDRHRYEAIARYTDHHIGRLIDGLKARHLWQDTVLIVTADHGDEFLDHGHRFHGKTLYEEMTHVPLLLRMPGLSAQTVDEPVGHIELAPTLLELLGLRIPSAYEGESRASELRAGKIKRSAPVFFEVLPDSNYTAHQVGMRDGQFKLIYRVKDHFFELYDLENDPRETQNIVHRSPRSDSLKKTLGRYVDRHLFSLAHGRSGATKPAGIPTRQKHKKRTGKKRPNRTKSNGKN